MKISSNILRFGLMVVAPLLLAACDDKADDDYVAGEVAPDN